MGKGKLKKALLNLGNKVLESGFGKTMDKAVALVGSPVKTITNLTKKKSERKDTTKEFYEKPLLNQIGGIVSTGIAVGTALITAGGSIGATGLKVGLGASQLVSVATKAPGLTGSVLQGGGETVSDLGDAVSDAETLKKNHSPEDIENFILSHPGVSIAAVIAAGYLTKGAYTAYLNWKQNQTLGEIIKEDKTNGSSNSNIPIQNGETAVSPLPVAESSPSGNMTSPGGVITPTNPSTPQMVSIDGTTKKKSSKKAKAKRSTIFNNNVQVNIQNVGHKSYNRKYIKEIIYA